MSTHRSTPITPAIADPKVHPSDLTPDTIVSRCPECKKVWTLKDDPNEWVYGHDCEA